MPIVVNAKGRRPNETRPHEVYIGRQTRNGWRKSKWANPFRLMSGYVNHGRNVVHMINADKIYALQRWSYSTVAPAIISCLLMVALSKKMTRLAATPSFIALAANTKQSAGGDYVTYFVQRIAPWRQ